MHHLVPDGRAGGAPSSPSLAPAHAVVDCSSPSSLGGRGAILTQPARRSSLRGYLPPPSACRHLPLCPPLPLPTLPSIDAPHSRRLPPLLAQLGPVPSKKSKTPKGGMRQRVQTLGGLRCIVYEHEGNLADLPIPLRCLYGQEQATCALHRPQRRPLPGMSGWGARVARL